MPSDGIPAANSLFVASIAKGFRVLECIADADHPLRITEIAACTGFDRSLVQRLTNTLHTLGYLARDTRDRRYALAIALLDFSYRYLCREPLMEAAMPRLVGLSDKIASRVAFGLHGGTDIVYVFRVPRSEFYHPTSHFGERQPVHATAAGRAVIAYLPESEARAVLQASERRSITPYTLVPESTNSCPIWPRSAAGAMPSSTRNSSSVRRSLPHRCTIGPIGPLRSSPVQSCATATRRTMERIAVALLQTTVQISRTAEGSRA